MKVHLVIIDSRPEYFRGADRTTSLVQMPFGSGDLLNHLTSQLKSACVPGVSILTDFNVRAGYEDAVRAISPSVDKIVPLSRFSRFLAAHEPSDWLLMIDPRCYPSDGYGAEDLVEGAAADPRWVRHLVALEDIESGAKEFVQLDAEGRVAKVQRYYEAVTWSLTSGVACSLLPVSSALIMQELPFSSLPELRSALAARGVPCQDVPVSGGVYDLKEERGLLEMGRASAVGLFARGGEESDRSPSAHLDAAARIVGPVVIQEEVAVDAEALILGPTILGKGCRIGRGAVVAQSVVPAGAVVKDGATWRHRLVVGLPPQEGERPRQRPFPGVMSGVGVRVLHSDGPRSKSIYPAVKLVVESFLALTALVLLSPLLLLVALLVRLGSNGPSLYGDKREGMGGQVFRCWKFRSMVVNAHALQQKLREASNVDGPQFKIENDPRVTRLGGILRKTNIDELPQLINVALGQMSFVGPRPSPFRENQTCIPWREGRLSVRPGITGLWQICRRDRSTGDFHQWIYYDLLYVRHMSPWMDVKILGATFITLGGKRSVPLTWIISPERLGTVTAHDDLRSQPARA